MDFLQNFILLDPINYTVKVLLLIFLLSLILIVIKMANQGKSVDEISQTTGLTKEEIEPIIKYHGRS